MSAFMVSNAHIDLLAKAFSEVCPGAIPQYTGLTLIEANSRSVCHRYAHFENDPDPEKRGFWKEAKRAPEFYEYREWGELPRADMIRMAAACYDYQACEHPDYERSPAKQIILEIERRWGKYSGDDTETTPWGIEEHHRPERVSG